MLPRSVWLALALACCWHVSSARADGRGDEYRSLIASALEEYELHNYVEAMSLFERAHRIKPSARTLRGMGLASYQAHRYVIAIGYLHAALEDPRKPLTPQFRREVQSALDDARGFVARFDLTLEPSGALLTVDGETVDARTGELLLDPGEHEVVATAEGYRTGSRRVKATSGRSGRIELRLVALDVPLVTTTAPQPPVQAAPAKTPGRPRAPDAPTAYKALAISGLSVALIGGALGTFAGLRTMDREQKLADACPDKECPPEHADLLTEAERWGQVSTASLVVGGVGLVAGVSGLWLWLRHRKRDLRAQSTKAHVTPLLMGAGAGLRGIF